MQLTDLPPADALFSDRVALADVARRVGRSDLPRLLDEIFDALDAALAGAGDAEVVFVPDDPKATDSEEGRGWTVGHIVAHVTAGLEETSAAASTLARGVEMTGRPRYEVPWETLTSAEAVRRRLAESRRMCRAFLETWPDEPHLENTYTPFPSLGPLNGPMRLLLSLGHARGHLPHLAEVLHQAQVSGVPTESSAVA
ncbi:MAG: DinB family protein [Chloroflexota bacterium]|nr:DinB family protein [Chloroflexota bacterium]